MPVAQYMNPTAWSRSCA